MTILNSTQDPLPAMQFRDLAGIFLCFLLCLIISSFGLSILFERLATSTPAMLMLSGSSGDPQLAASGVARLIKPWLIFAILLLALKGHFPKESLRKILALYGFGPLPSLKILLCAFGAGILVVQLFTKVLIPIFESEKTLIPHPSNELNALPQLFLLLIVLNLFTLVPVAEEFLFRGVLYTGLAAIWNKPLAMIVTSVGFMALHPENLSSGSTLTHLGMVVITAMMVVAREKSGALYVPIMLHAGFNFSSAVIS